MWQHNVYYVCVTFNVVRYVGLSTVQVREYTVSLISPLLKIKKKKTLHVFPPAVTPQTNQLLNVYQGF